MTLNTGLEASYHFTNSDFSDWSGNGNTATNNGTTATTDKNGVANNARSFNGSTTYMTTTTTPIQGTANKTQNVWIKTSSTSTQVITHFGTAANGENWIAQINGTTSLGLYVFGGFRTWNVNVADGSWHMITIVLDGDSTNDLKLYVDTVEISATSTTDRVINIGNTYKYIGRQEAGTYFNGVMDELRLYDRALSDYEVLQLYYGYDSEDDFINTLLEGCEAAYNFDGDSNDETGNSNDGTDTNITYVTGKIGQAASLNGSTSYIVTSSSLGISNSISIVGWIKGDSTTGSGNFIVCERDGTNQNWYMQLSTSGNLIFGIYDGGTPYQVVGTSNLFDDTWHFVTGIYDGTTIYVYVDTVEENTFSHTGSIDTDTTPINIGRRGDNTRLFNGDIDILNIYNRALLVDEITALYNSGDGLQYPFSAKTNNALMFGTNC